ncbi:MAG: LamG domain-containing protein [Bacteroidota bacterium]|nr:LamG domain-containing protein [Bacteroidota bacterium]
MVELELLPTTGTIEIYVTWGGKCTTPPSGLVSWWSGDGTANDIVGSNHGMLINGATYGSGKVRRAFSFDGIDDYVRIPHSPSLNPSGSFTVDAWIYPTRDAHATIIGKWGDRGSWSGQRSWNIAVRPNRRINFSISDSIHQNDSTFHSFKTKVNAIVCNQWNHVAGVYDQLTGTRRIYINGVNVAERDDQPISIFKSIADVSIGTELFSPYTMDYFFPGRIDEVDFYHKALTDEEIKAIYYAGRSGKCR